MPRIANRIKGAWALSLLVSAPLFATEFNEAELRLVDGQMALKFNQSLGEGIVALFHSTSLHKTRNSWDFIRLHPIREPGSDAFQVSSYFSPAIEAGFFEVRPSPFVPPDRMVWIEPGSLLLGSPADEFNRYPDEGPQHPVTIEHGFWLGKYEVTQAEFESVMKVNPSRAHGNPRAPVENVSWIDAARYCISLTEQARESNNLPPGYEYRLPTEAEWEYACRAGTDSAYSFGDEISQLSEYGWWANNSGAQPYEGGLLKPNTWGLYDMHGNVFEWCHSKYEAYPGGEIRTLKIDYRVVRGGAFICPAEIVRSACRFESAPSRSASWLTGFRVALAPILPTPEPLL